MEHKTRFLPWFREHVDRFPGLLFDIDGTLVRHKVLLDEAKDTLEFLRSRQIPHLFLTNDAMHSHQEKSRSLQAVDLPIFPEMIVSSGDAIREFVQQRRLQGELFFIMGKLGDPNYAETAGLNITRKFSELRDCRGVIIGETAYDWESTFNAVLNYFLKKPDGLLVVPNRVQYRCG